MQSDRIHPIPDAHIEAVKAVVEPAVRDMIEFQLLCGLRPAELCAMRPCDLDMSGGASGWTYRPPHNGHHVVHLGPQARELLRSRLTADRPADAPLFVPLEQYAEAIRAACHRAAVPPFDPNRLRLTATYRMALQYGPAEAEAILGHGEPPKPILQWVMRGPGEANATAAAGSAT